MLEMNDLGFIEDYSSEYEYKYKDVVKKIIISPLKIKDLSNFLN